jgi:hypothetical protein
MANIFPYISEDLTSGQSVDLKLHMIRWRTVGHGRLKTVSDFELEIGGRVDLSIYQGDIQVQILLLDRDEKSNSGPCSLQLNEYRDDKATYNANGDFLTIAAVIGGADVKIKLSRFGRDNMTECTVSGALDLTVYVEPL